MTRLPSILLLALAITWQCADAARPNFLLLYTDDQRWDALGVVQREMGDKARFPWFQTPNLDRLASEGIRFRNAFVTTSLCAPSRAVFLTGRYNHLNGVANNFTPFPTNNVTWATELRKAGYATAYIGKWHMDSQRGQRPGFDYSASFIGHARYLDAPFEINGVPAETKGWVDDVSTDYAIGFMRQHKDKPWGMAVGFKTPHGPCEPPARWADKFADGWFRPTPNLTNPPAYAGSRYASPLAPAPHGPPGALQANLNYFRCLGAMDENVGRIMKALDDLGLARDTLVVFASDNGFYLREHSLGDKRSAYDESLRIPMLVRFPATVARGRVMDEMVLNLDFAPTALDLAGVPIPSTMQGRSWRPLLEDKPTQWRTSYFYEYFWEQQQGGSPPSMTAVRTTTAKLIKYKDHAEWTELFDLARDPYETRNLYRDPAAANLRSALETEYERQKLAVAYAWPDYASDPEKFRPQKPLDGWVLDFRFDRLAEGQVTDASGKGNHGRAKALTLVDGRNGGKAARFDGRSSAQVANSATLNPGVRAYNMEVVFNPNQPDGVLLAHGGESNGYLLSLEKGRLVFRVVAGRRVSLLTGPEAPVGQWTTVRSGYQFENGLWLAVDAQLPIRTPLNALLERQPADGLQVGADEGSQLLGKTKPGFDGLIESVRIYSGEMPDKR
jgi:arylsulfatase A-like enzyme